MPAITLNEIYEYMDKEEIPIKVGQIYEMVNPNDDPFCTPTYAKVCELKTNNNGKLWIRYQFVFKRKGQWGGGMLDNSDLASAFINRYKLYEDVIGETIHKVKEVSKAKETTEKKYGLSAIEQLEI